MEQRMQREGRLGWGLVLALAASVAAGEARAAFQDVTLARGLAYTQHTPNESPGCLLFDGQFCEPERMTGGAAVGDVDGDGDLDLFATRLEQPDLLFCNRLAESGAATFEDCTEEAGLAGFDLASNGAAFGDIDRDGDLDLYVTTVGDTRFYLFVNDGDGRFTEEALARGDAALQDPSPHVGYSVTFGDYDRDGWLDIHVTEWRPLFIGGASARTHTRLLRNRGGLEGGCFDDVTDTAQVAIPNDDQYAFASTFTDLDGDGWPDLALAADFGTTRLFWNDGDGTFTDGTAAARVGTDENGMGSTFGDYDGDGDLDWFVTSIFDPDDTCETAGCNWGITGNRLYRNEGGRSFLDRTGDEVVGVRDGRWGWGAAFFDYDNDGDLDLVMTNGVDFPGVDFDAPFVADPIRLWRNDGPDQWTEVAALEGVADTGSGKGLLVFDYDADGDLDLFVVDNGGAGRLYENLDGNANHHLRVQLQGLESNAHGLGARVSLQRFVGGTVQVREVGTSTHFLGWSETVAHFGLGSEPGVYRVAVRWPSGRLQQRVVAGADRTLVLSEPLPPPCGLLGIEALLDLAPWLWRHRGSTVPR